MSLKWKVLKNLSFSRSSLEEESGSDHDMSKPRGDEVLPVIVDIPDEETLQGIESEKQLVDGAPDKETELVPGDVGEAVCRASESDEEASSEVVDKLRGGEDSKEEDRTSMGESEVADNIRTFLDLASSLLNEWTSLKEVFRIPKKERIEQMKEHEREAGGFICNQRGCYLILYRGHRKISHESTCAVSVLGYLRLLCFPFECTCLFFLYSSSCSAYGNVTDASVTVFTSSHCFGLINSQRIKPRA
jgi:hypothetical protein